VHSSPWYEYRRVELRQRGTDALTGRGKAGLELSLIALI
jgi:hypothetical protein